MLKSIKMTECAIPFSPLLLCFPHISCYGLIKGLCLHRVKTNTDIEYFTANGVFYPHSCLQEYSLTGRLGFYLYTVCMYVCIYNVCTVYIYHTCCKTWHGTPKLPWQSSKINFLDLFWRSKKVNYQGAQINKTFRVPPHSPSNNTVTFCAAAVR